MSSLAHQVLMLEKINNDILAFAKLVSSNLEGKQTFINDLLKKLNTPACADKNWHAFNHLREIEELQVYSATLLILDKEKKRVALRALRLKEKEKSDDI